MALRGSIDDVHIVDVLQFVHLSGKSGALLMTSPQGPAWIEFSQGDVIFARSAATRTLGELLLEKGHLSREQLRMAIAEQKQGVERIPLGQILLARGLIGRDALIEAVRRQIQTAMMDIVGLKTGEFQFDQSPIEPADDIRLDAHDVLPMLRLDTQYLLLEAMRAFDEERRPAVVDGRAAPALPPATSLPADHLVAAEQLRAPHIVADPLPLPQFPALASPNPRPARRTEGQGGIILVGFEKALVTVLASQLTGRGFRVAAHIPSSHVDEQLLGDKPWPSTMIVIWRVRTDSLEKTPGPDQARRSTQLDALGSRRPHWPVVALVSGWDVDLIGQLYARGVRAALPVDPLAASANPEASLGGLCSVVSHLWRDTAVASEAQAAELRAWLQAKTVTTEMQRAIQRAAIALELMRVAAGTFERAALFLAKGDDLIGLGAFGFTMDGRPMAESLRGLALSIKAGTELERSLRDRVPLTAPARELGLSRVLFDIAGVPTSGKAALIPVVGSSRVIGVLYGDNGLLNRPLRSLHAMEMAAAQAGLAYENALLRIRLDGNRSPLPAAVG